MRLLCFLLHLCDDVVHVRRDEKVVRMRGSYIHNPYPLFFHSILSLLGVGKKGLYEFVPFWKEAVTYAHGDQEKIEVFCKDLVFLFTTHQTIGEGRGIDLVESHLLV